MSLFDEADSSAKREEVVKRRRLQTLLDINEPSGNNISFFFIKRFS
jgi:hypothetical protein